MSTLTIPLAKVVPDLEDNPDPAGLTKEALWEHYSFLGQEAEIAVQGEELRITAPEPSGYQRDQLDRCLLTYQMPGL